MLRRFLVSCVLVAGLAAPTAASTVTLRDWTLGDFANNASGGGGPFKATTTGVLLGDTEFITFCLEYNEYFRYDIPYDFVLSDSASHGGAGGTPDPLSDATKWLYYQVLSPGYASAYNLATGLTLNADVGAVFQYAIWYLEEERTLTDIGGPTSGGYLLASYALANQDWASLFGAGHRVYAMNMTDSSGRAVQDQLAYGYEAVHMPEPGSLVLLGTGLLALSRRYLKKRQAPPSNG